MKELNATFNPTYFSNYTRERLKRAVQEMKIVKTDCINNTVRSTFALNYFVDKEPTFSL